jgi:hypothetical protein
MAESESNLLRRYSEAHAAVMSFKVDKNHGLEELKELIDHAADLGDQLDAIGCRVTPDDPAMSSIEAEVPQCGT